MTAERDECPSCGTFSPKHCVGKCSWRRCWVSHCVVDIWNRQNRVVLRIKP